MAAPSHPEYSGLELTAHFEDADGADSLPTTVHWGAFLTETDETIIDWTSVTPGVDVLVEVPGSLVTLRDRTSKREGWYFAFIADKDTDREYASEPPFYVDIVRRGRRG